MLAGGRFYFFLEYTYTKCNLNLTLGQITKKNCVMQNKNENSNDYQKINNSLLSLIFHIKKRNERIIRGIFHKQETTR